MERQIRNTADRIRRYVQDLDGVISVMHFFRVQPGTRFRLRVLSKDIQLLPDGKWCVAGCSLVAAGERRETPGYIVFRQCQIIFCIYVKAYPYLRLSCKRLQRKSFFMVAFRLLVFILLVIKDMK